MKAFLVISVARQLLGDYIFVRSNKAFIKASAAENYMNELKKDLIGPDGQPKKIRLNTPNGDIECIAEVAIHEIEIEE